MAGKTVLVIDTDIDTEQQIMSTLESAGYLVFAAQTDDVLSENALKVSPSLLFFSAPASGAKGLETCRLIHDNKAFTGIPIIVLTPFAEPMEPQYTESYGIVDIIRMPFAAEDLLQKTEAALSGKTAVSQGKVADGGMAKKETELPKAPFAPSPPPSPAPEQKPKAGGKVKGTPSPAGGDIPLKDVFGDIGRKEQPAYPPPLTPKKKSKTALVLSLVLVLVLVLAGVAAYFLKDVFFPPAKQAAVTRPVQTPPKPSAPVVLPVPAPAQPEAVKPEAPAASEQKNQPVSQAKQPPAAAQAKPAETPAPAAVQSRTGFSVQLGAFRDGAHAEELAKKFKAKGYDAFVKKVSSTNKGTVYKVLVGKYSDRKECQKMAESLFAKEKVKGVIYSD